MRNVYKWAEVYTAEKREGLYGPRQDCTIGEAIREIDATIEALERKYGKQPVSEAKLRQFYRENLAVDSGVCCDNGKTYRLRRDFVRVPDSTDDPLTPTIDGRVIDDSGETWADFALFPRLTDEQAEEYCEIQNWCAYYSGPGRSFSHGPYWQHTKRRTLIKFGQGLDI